jgi:hypothetical protein
MMILSMIYCHSHKQSIRICNGILVNMLFFCALACCQTGDSHISTNISDSEIWKKYASTASDLLVHASDCIQKSLRSTDKCDFKDYLNKAAIEYASMQAMLGDGLGNSDEVAYVAQGFVRSGCPVRAAEYLLLRPGIKGESGLLRLLADALFSMGDDKSAALAYKLWISTGCGGYRSAIRTDNLVILVEKGKECFQLPSFLRSRLEWLKQALGEPSNLPAMNDPPVIDIWK